MNIKKVSVVVPVYNSEKTLEELFLRTKLLMEKMQLPFEMIFVDDCGPDGSWNVIQNIKRQNTDQVIAVKLSKNSGQHNALMCGFNLSTGDVVVTIDDDLQTPPEDISKLIVNYINTSPDVVYGIYKEKQHNKFRNLGSKLIKSVVGYAFDAKPEGSSFRLLRGSLIKRLITHKQSYVFIDGLIHWHTTSINYELVDHTKRQHGQSTYNIKKLIALSLNLIFNFTVLPLRLITIIGLLFSALSFLFGLYFIYKRLFNDVPLGYTSIIVSIFFSTSIILMGIGIIGEYLSRIYMHQNDKPQYSTKDIL